MTGARVLIADDHVLVRHGLRRIIDAEPDLTVIAEAGDGAHALEAVHAHPVDLAVLDVSMPVLTGLQAARRITTEAPHVRVLMLSMHDNEQYLFEALRAGASGYVLKTAADRDLIEACRAVLRGLRMVLDAQPDLEVVAEATDGDAAVERALADDVHLAILDISMPRKTGLQAAREITQRKPEIRVLMLSMHDNEQYLFEALRAGASGYVLKTAADCDLVEACRAVLRGQPFLYPSGIAVLIRDFLDRARDGDELPGDALTPRELEVVKLVAEGHTSDEIAELLVISRPSPGEHAREARDARPRRTHALRHQTRTRRALSRLRGRHQRST